MLKSLKKSMKKVAEKRLNVYEEYPTLYKKLYFKYQKKKVMTYIGVLCCSLLNSQINIKEIDIFAMGVPFVMIFIRFVLTIVST